MTVQALHDHNKIAQACANHRPMMISSERLLVNERYDNGSEEPTNVKEYIYTFGCSTCKCQTTLKTINK
jgi:hypothetical protein